MRSLVVLAALSAAAGAAAADEGEQALSLTASYARFSIPDWSPHGGVIGADYERGVSDALAVRASAGGGAYFGDGTHYSAHAVVGITYAFDVVKYVPYANLGAGGILIGGGGIDLDVHPLVELGIGLDFLREPDFSWGLQVRFESFVEQTAFFTAGARATWRWGFF
jgi:hypothetical protein